MQSQFGGITTTRASTKPKRKGRADDLVIPKFEEEENSTTCDFSRMSLKEGHERYPMWVCPNMRIFLEAFSGLYKEASMALTAIAEPVSRPELIHEYMLTPYSLYAAVSVRMERKSIIEVLAKYAKNKELPVEVVKFINQCTRRYGKAKIVLKNNRYFIECTE